MIATLLLTVQQQVVSSGKRRVVDCHWQRAAIAIFANRLNWFISSRMAFVPTIAFTRGNLIQTQLSLQKKAVTKPVAA